MALSEKAKNNKKRYIREYTKDNYKRITLDIRKADFELIEKAAAASGESVSGYIKKAIMQRVESENN